MQNFEFFGFFDYEENDGDAYEFTSDEYSEIQQSYIGSMSGVLKGKGSELSADIGLSGVTVTSGAVYINGRYGRNNNAVTLALDAVSSGYNRIDVVLARVDKTSRIICLDIKKGTETTGTPVAPSIVNNSNVQEMGLWKISFNSAGSVGLEDIRSYIYPLSGMLPKSGGVLSGNVAVHDVVPCANETYNLGASNKYWQYGYIKTLYAATITGHEVTGNILPKTANSYDLGASTAIWKNIYANTLMANGNITVNNNGGAYKSYMDINDGFARWCTDSGAASGAFQAFKVRISDGVVSSPSIYNLPTTSAGNVFMTSSGQLCKGSTSSRRFKDNIKPVDMAEIIRCLRALEVKNYTSKCAIDDKKKVRTGGIAEQFREVDERLAVINAENPELTDAIDTSEVLYRLLAGWQWCDSEMETMKVRITALEAKGA